MKAALLFAAIVLIFVALANSLSPVKLVIRPQICLAPCTVRLGIRIEKDAANAMLRVLVEGPITRYSEIPLTATSPTVFSLDYKDLPAGSYGVAVDLVRHDGTTWVVGKVTGVIEVTGDNP